MSQSDGFQAPLSAWKVTLVVVLHRENMDRIRTYSEARSWRMPSGKTKSHHLASQTCVVVGTALHSLVPWRVQMQVTCYSLIHLRTSSPRQLANENIGNKQSWNPNVPWKWLEGMYSTNWDISNLIYKPLICKHKSKVFPFFVVFSLS